MSSPKKKRLLLAAVDVGFRIGHYSRFIREELNDKLEVESFSKYVLPSEHFKTEFTYTCPINETRPLRLYLYCACFFIRALFRYDVFHFISGETILTRKLRRFELRMYRLFGKKVIMHFVGSDIRSEKYLEEKTIHLREYLAGEYTIKAPVSEPFQESLIRDSKKFAHQILVSTPDLLNIIPEASYFPVLLDFENSDFAAAETRDPGKITILHSPSATMTKGSDYIHEILKEIQRSYGNRIELLLPGNRTEKVTNYATTRYDLLSKMAQSDIVIDQMVIGWYGLKTAEALATGCLVFCYIDEQYEHLLPQDCPIINASVPDLEKKLTEQVEKLLKNGDTTSRKPTQLAYVKDFHGIERYRQQLQKLWLN